MVATFDRSTIEFKILDSGEIIFDVNIQHQGPQPLDFVGFAAVAAYYLCGSLCGC